MYLLGWVFMVLSRAADTVYSIPVNSAMGAASWFNLPVSQANGFQLQCLPSPRIIGHSRI